MVLELTVLALAALAYRRGLTRLHALPAGAALVPTWRVAAFGTGIVVAAVATSPPIHDLAHQSLSAHMLQHVLLILVAAPLLSAGAPQLVVPRAVPGLTRRVAAPFRRRVPVTAGPAPALLVGGTVAHLAMLWVWHAPALYDAAVHHWLVHALEHALFVGTAMLVWTGLLHPGRQARLRSGVGVVCIWLLLLNGGVLSSLFVFSREPLFDAYAGGVDALADQQLAGLIMWLPGGLVYGLAGVTTFVRWYRAMEERAQARDPGSRPPLVVRAPDGAGDR